MHAAIPEQPATGPQSWLGADEGDVVEVFPAREGAAPGAEPLRATAG